MQGSKLRTDKIRSLFARDRSLQRVSTHFVRAQIWLAVLALARGLVKVLVAQNNQRRDVFCTQEVDQ